MMFKVEDAVHVQGIALYHCPYVILRRKRSAPRRLIDQRAAHEDEALVAESIDQHRIFIPRGLLAPSNQEIAIGPSPGDAEERIL